ncbi:MAG: hypothetical protein ABIM88_02365 [candidate division WOR-3 bacterium]
MEKSVKKRTGVLFALGILTAAASVITSTGTAFFSLYMLFLSPQGFVKPFVESLFVRIHPAFTLLISLILLAIMILWIWISLALSWYPGISFLEDFFSHSSGTRNPVSLIVGFSILLSPFLEMLVASFISEFKPFYLERTFLLILGTGVIAVLGGLAKRIPHTLSYLSSMFSFLGKGPLAWASVGLGLVGFLLLYIQLWLSGLMGGITVPLFWHILFAYVGIASYHRIRLLSILEALDRPNQKP